MRLEIEMTKENSSSLVFGSVKWFWNTLIHQAVAVIAVYTIWNFCINGLSVTAWHVILCSLGYIPLMVEAIILFGGDNVWTQGLNRKNKYYVHGALLFLATGFITVGISLEINRKAQNNYSHLQSIHSITGFTSFILVIVSVLLGVAAASGRSLSNLMRPVWFKFLHNCLGTAAFVIGVISLLYGYQTGRFTKFTSEESRLVATVVIAIITIWTLRTPLISCYEQIKTIFYR